MKNKKFNYIFLIIYAIAIFGLFFVISKWTPLAGDDWGYAYNGMNGNAFNLALEHYQTWSGRFLSELWGFAVAPNKALWNILNPLIFMGVFVFTTLIGSYRKQFFVTGALVIMLMLNVQINLRMETYTWIMGTTYVIPLLLSLIYLYLIKRFVLDKNNSYLITILTSLLLLMLSLFMENIAGAMLIAVIMIATYDYMRTKKFKKIYIWNFCASILGIAIIRLAPGAQARLESLGGFANMSFFEKIVFNFSSFIKYTFIENKYLILVLSLVLVVLIIKKLCKNKNNNLHSNLMVLSALYLFMCSILVFIPNYIELINFIDLSMLVDYANPITWSIWIIYVLVVFYVIIMCINNSDVKNQIIFFVLIAGISNAAMLISPIFESRSSLYFVYFMIIAICMMFGELKVKNRLLMIFCFLIFSLFSLRKVNEFYYKYQKVNEINNERMEIIKYYQLNPTEDAHIPRMPPFTVHGADIEDDDEYHQEYFKYYYGLPSDMNLIFEWKDSYD